MKTEKDLQNYLKRECQKNGISFDKVESRSRRGFPDIFMAKNGLVVLAELKSPSGTGKVSELQLRCIADLIGRGVPVFIVDSVAGVTEVVELFDA